jgi:hypothetical protein
VVPRDLSPETSSTEGLFPGPAVTPPAEIPTSKPQSETDPSTDTLFEEPAAPVAVPEADTKVTDDSFVEPTQPAADDTETPANEPTETEEPAAESNPLDNLFGPSTPAEEPAPPKEESDEPENTDPFGQLELPTLEVTASLAGSMPRPWTDLGTNFRCEARLVRMTSAGVFLEKASGELVELSFAELSDADLHFVREQVRAERAMLAPAHVAALESR